MCYFCSVKSFKSPLFFFCKEKRDIPVETEMKLQSSMPRKHLSHLQDLTTVLILKAAITTTLTHLVLLAVHQEILQLLSHVMLVCLTTSILPGIMARHSLTFCLFYFLIWLWDIYINASGFIAILKCPLKMRTIYLPLFLLYQFA